MPFEKNLLGYTHNHKHTCYTSYFVKATSSSMPNACYAYCGKNGCFVNNCYVKRKVERGEKTLWVVKGTISNQMDPRKFGYQKSLSLPWCR